MKEHYKYCTKSQLLYFFQYFTPLIHVVAPKFDIERNIWIPMRFIDLGTGRKPNDIAVEMHSC